MSRRGQSDRVAANGVVVLTDGSANDLPTVPVDKIDKVSYVPMTFAQSRVTAVSADLDDMKRKYESHVVRMKEYFDTSLENTKAHYENYIVSLKQKAVHHVELERALKREREEHFEGLLKKSQENEEELRDKLAELNREYQENIRKLKTQLQQTSKMLADTSVELSDLHVRYDCTEVLNNSLRDVEMLYIRDVMAVKEADWKDCERSLLARIEDGEAARRQLEQSMQAEAEVAAATISSWVQKFELSQDEVRAADLRTQDERSRSACGYKILECVGMVELNSMTCERDDWIQRRLDDLESSRRSHEQLMNSVLLDHERERRDADAREDVRALLGQMLIRIESDAWTAQELVVSQLDHKIVAEHEDAERTHHSLMEELRCSLEAEHQASIIALAQSNQLVLETSLSDLREKLEAEFHALVAARDEEISHLKEELLVLNEKSIKLKATERGLVEQHTAFNVVNTALSTAREHNVVSSISRMKQELIEAHLKIEALNRLASDASTFKALADDLSVALAASDAKVRELSEQLLNADALMETQMRTSEDNQRVWTQTLTESDERVNSMKRSVEEAEKRIAELQDALSQTEILLKDTLHSSRDGSTRGSDDSAGMSRTESKAQFKSSKSRESLDAVPVESDGAVTRAEPRDSEQQEAAAPKPEVVVAASSGEKKSSRAQDKTSKLQTNPSSESVADKVAEKIRDEDRETKLMQRIKELEDEVQRLSQASQLTIATNPAIASKPEVSELDGLVDDVFRYEDSLKSLKDKENVLKTSIADLSKRKVAKKAEIKAWMQDFRQKNGRAPEKSDKEEVRELFEEYQLCNDELQGKYQESQELSLEVRGVEDQVAKLKSNFQRMKSQSVIQVDFDSTSMPASRGNNANEEVAVVESAAREPAALAAASDVDLAREQQQAIEELEDQLFNLREELESQKQTVLKAEAEKTLLHSQLEALIKEKRTDVVQQFEEEIAQLRANEIQLTTSVTELTKAKAIADGHLAELKDRAEKAEDELKERDSREVAKLSPTDERVVLKSEIGKQRAEIVMKKKAVTAGWDAAAVADERRAIDVEKAYQKGLNEGRQKNNSAWNALNSAVEKKEARITELLVVIADHESKELADKLVVEDLKKQIEALKVEMADAVAVFATDSDGGGGGGGPDLDAAREGLEAAQEEIVAMSEKVESMENEIKILDQKINVYEQMIADMTSTISSSNAASTAKLSGAASNTGGEDDLNMVVVYSLKQSFVKGGSLWKVGKRDECFAVYVKSCEDVLPKLRQVSSPLRAMLQEAVITAKQQTGAQGKVKGAQILRKAMDAVIADCQQTLDNAAASRESALIASSSAPGLGSGSSLMNNLKSQIAILDKERSMAVSIRGGEDGGASGGAVEESAGEVKSGTGSSGSALLLQRAKAAEAKVEVLKKQLVAALASRGEQITAEGATNLSTTVSAGATLKPAGAAPAASKVLGKADPAEIRKLQRQVKELEAKLQSSQSEGGGGTDKKAVAALEKQMQKKIKDMETNFRKEKAAVEARAIKAEAALESAAGSLPLITAERDDLRVKVKELSALVVEVENLRVVAARGVELEQLVQAKDKDIVQLQEQFKKEAFLRKKYKNELEDLKGAIRVYARCRPMAEYEKERGCSNVVQFVDDTTLRVTTARGDKQFEFDSAFSAQSTQLEVFEDTKRLVESCMDGYNVCLFAYGQTGSGKTHTMTGTPDNPGLTPNAVQEMFNLIQERSQCVCSVTTYFVELYNDNLVDLYWQLDNDRRKAEPPKLEIKMDEKKMVFIKGCVIKEANSAEELMNLFRLGNQQRHVGATKMNAESSRSHSIFAIMIQSYDRNTKKSTTGKLSLVDLAGSERADKTGASAERLKEAQNINKSLSALGNVIAALSEGEKFVPYRDNKLTQLMQDSLGGNAKTLMFVNFSPADYNCDETITSLNYATRVKKITNNASKQAESEEVARLKNIIRRLQGGGAGGGVPIPELEAVEDMDRGGDRGRDRDGATEPVWEDDEAGGGTA